MKQYRITENAFYIGHTICFGKAELVAEFWGLISKLKSLFLVKTLCGVDETNITKPHNLTASCSLDTCYFPPLEKSIDVT